MCPVARTSRWERPPEPKDLRWFVRLLGKTLICAGLLMFGFVAYQLWGTGIEYSRAQARLDDEFEELLAERGVEATTPRFSSIGSTTTPEPSATSPPAPATSPSTAAPTTTPSTTTPQTSPPAEAPVRDFRFAADADVIGTLWIPTIGIEDQKIVQGVGREELKQGPGHYPGTPFPGEYGNAAIAGHRTTYGGPFIDLPELDVGDEIAVITVYGRYTYRVTGWEVVNPSDSHVVQTTNPREAMLTLTTCTPIGTAAQRHIVYAELIPELSDEAGRYVQRGADGVSALPGDEPAATASTAAATTTVANGTVATGTAAAAAPSTTSTATAAPSTTDAAPIDGGDAPPAAGGGEDGFANHWFTDKGALPQIGLWGAGAIAVVVGAYYLAKWRRNSWLGLAAGFAPFAVTLYFAYQNINRLLPAAL